MRKWVPSAIEEEDREKRIRLLLNQAFCVNEFRTLPAEVRNEITPHLLKEYSLSTINNAWLGRQGVEADNFDWEGEIWAEYVKIDGKWYISNLANLKRTDRGMSIQLRKPQVLNAIHIAIDYLGVRRIILEPVGSPTADGHMADPEPGVWWYSARVALPKVDFRRDVSRSLLRPNECSPLELTSSSSA